MLDKSAKERAGREDTILTSVSCVGRHADYLASALLIICGKRKSFVGVGDGRRRMRDCTLILVRLLQYLIICGLHARPNSLIRAG